MLEKVKFAMLCMARQCWEQGMAAQAMLETGDKDALFLLARDCVVRQNADGRLCDVENTPALVDPAVCVEPVLTVGKLLGNDAYIEAAKRNVDYLLNKAPKSADGARYHLMGRKEVWADSMAMGPHVLMLWGHADEGMRFYRAIEKRLRDPETGLYRHKWSEREQRFTRGCFWGVGNGWALVGLMRMTEALRALNDARAAETARDFTALASRMATYQGENGLFHDVLTDTSTFYESESTEMFAYSLYKMVSWGETDARLLPAADRAREAVLKRVDDFGILQGAAGSPTFEEAGTSVEGQAHLLMMEAARALLKRR